MLKFLQHQLAIALLLIGRGLLLEAVFRCCHYTLMCPPLVTVHSNNTGKLVPRPWSTLYCVEAQAPVPTAS